MRALRAAGRLGVGSSHRHQADARLRQVALAAGDRIKTAGDILDYPEFFCADDQLAIDAKDFDKRVRQAGAGPLLRRLREQLATVEPFDAAGVETRREDVSGARGAQDRRHHPRAARGGHRQGGGAGHVRCPGDPGPRRRSLDRIDRTLEML